MVYDISLNRNALFVTNKVDAALQQLDLVFNTENTELIADSTYGTNFLTFLWTNTPTTAALKEYIVDTLNKCEIFASFSYDVFVTYINEIEDQFYHVQILLYYSNTAEPISKTYKLKNTDY